jgi:hypothetical protein
MYRKCKIFSQNSNILSPIYVKYFCHLKSRQERIIEILNKNFNPTYLDVMNESYRHNVPKNSETHFKILLVNKKIKAGPKLKFTEKYINY